MPQRTDGPVSSSLGTQLCLNFGGIPQLKDPNAWGLYDMIGNVFEWTSTLATLQAGGPYVDYGADLLRPDGVGALGWSPELRGGSFSGPPDVQSAGKSLGGVPREHAPDNGLRLVQTLPAATERR